MHNVTGFVAPVAAFHGALFCDSSKCARFDTYCHPCWRLCTCCRIVQLPMSTHHVPEGLDSNSLGCSMQFVTCTAHGNAQHDMHPTQHFDKKCQTIGKKYCCD